MVPALAKESAAAKLVVDGVEPKGAPSTANSAQRGVLTARMIFLQSQLDATRRELAALT